MELFEIMNYKNRIHKFLKEAPMQIEILKNEYSKIFDSQECKNQLNDLKSYEKRMVEGLLFLENLKDQKIIDLINKIVSHPKKLLAGNKKRYLSALRAHQKKVGIHISKGEIKVLVTKLKKIPLIHSTKNYSKIFSNGITPASKLWMTKYKSCANAMDIALGLDNYVFLTHGFVLENFSKDFVAINNNLINSSDTLISGLDLFTFVLIKTKKVAPCSIQTKEWIKALEDYSKNIFSGKNFWEIKAEYILTFFKSIDEYNNFAKKHYYKNTISMAPLNEYPFLGEIKVLGNIRPEQIQP